MYEVVATLIFNLSHLSSPFVFVALHTSLS